MRPPKVNTWLAAAPRAVRNWNHGRRGAGMGLGVAYTWEPQNTVGLTEAVDSDNCH